MEVEALKPEPEDNPDGTLVSEVEGVLEFELMEPSEVLEPSLVTLK